MPPPPRSTKTAILFSPPKRGVQGGVLRSPRRAGQGARGKGSGDENHEGRSGLSGAAERDACSVTGGGGDITSNGGTARQTVASGDGTFYSCISPGLLARAERFPSVCIVCCTIALTAVTY